MGCQARAVRPVGGEFWRENSRRRLGLGRDPPLNGRRLGRYVRLTFFDPLSDLGTDKDRIDGQPRKDAAKQAHAGPGIEFVVDDQVGPTAIAAKPTSALKIVVAHLDIEPFNEGFKFLQESGVIHRKIIGPQTAAKQGNCWEPNGGLLL